MRDNTGRAVIVPGTTIGSAGEISFPPSEIIYEQSEKWIDIQKKDTDRKRMKLFEY